MSGARRLLHAAEFRERALDLTLVLPLIGLLVVFLGYPFLYGLDLSLHQTQGFAVTGWAGIEHYIRALTGDAVFRQGLANTLVLTGAAVVLQVGIGLGLAVLVAGSRRGRTFFRIAFVAPFVLAPVAAGAVWKFMYAPFFGVVPSIGKALGLDLSTVAPLADPNVALWAVVLVFVWRFAGFAMVVYLAAIQSIPREYYEFGEIEGIGRLGRLRHITWPLLWPQTFALTLLTTIGTLRVFDLVWIMTGGGPQHATETAATYVYSTAFQSLDVGYAQAMATILMVLILALALIEFRLLGQARGRGRDVSAKPAIRGSTVVLVGLAVVWIYPIVWTFTNAVKTTADLYRGPLDLPNPPALGNLAEAWNRANLGGALLNSTYVASLTVVGTLLVAIPAAFALTKLRPPARAALFVLILAPLIIPTEVLIVPLFAIYRNLGLIDSLPGVAAVNVVFSVSFATVVLAAFFRRIPQELIDAARLDGAGRLALLTTIAMPLARPGIVAVGVLVAIFSWNDFAGALVLLQRPDVFTAPLALTTFSTFFSTDEGLRFAGLAITFVPPLIVFLLLQRNVVQGLSAGTPR